MKKRKHSQKKTLSKTNILVLLSLSLVITIIIIYGIIINNINEKNKNHVNSITPEIRKNIDTHNNNEINELEKYRQERIEKLSDKIYEENNTNLYKEYNENIKEESKKEKEKEKNIKIKEVENKSTVFIDKIKEKLKIDKKEEIKDLHLEDKKTEIKHSNKKAKLILIIDDVSSSSQVKSILSLKHNITMSFLPPSSNHLNSAKIAKPLPFYMIHIPLQASKAFKFQENKTLGINDSYEEIESYVKKIRDWYPNGKYINNHTGSRFTSNDKAMSRLFKALDKYNFHFIDSRTTAKSYGKKYAKKYNIPYISRNIFLDNNQNFFYIQNQLQKAIKIAKKNGVSIAIGHPYPITLNVIKNSNHLFKDIDLIYLNAHPKLK